MDHEFGQVEVPNENDAPARIHCIAAESQSPLKKGDEVIITSQIEGENKYIAVSVDAVGRT